MAVTDLTGTKWKLISGSPVSLAVKTTRIFNINYTVSFTHEGNDYQFDKTQFSPFTNDNGIWLNTADKVGSPTVAALAYANNLQWVAFGYSVNHVHQFNTTADITYFITGGTDATNATLISWLEANATQIVPSRKSVDLTTLAGWEALSSGAHNITIVAKADGYRDSAPSAAVSVEKAAPAYTDCLTFTSEGGWDFTLYAQYKEWDGVLEYSTDHNTWTTLSDANVEMSSVNGKLYLRGSGNTRFYTNNGAQFVLSERAGCSGNIQTLLDYKNPPTSIPADNCYRNMFSYCYNLTTAPELPATTLANGCYYGMFENCMVLTTAPELPATTLADNCYTSMFQDCAELTTAPELPATTLANDCYCDMLHGCGKLTTAPELPATTLANGCYYGMFKFCRGLKISATQSSEYPTAWRIPSYGTISSTAPNWNTDMLSDTAGTFTSDPSINTTYYGAW